MRICWDAPPPRMVVTSKITTVLVGDPYLEHPKKLRRYDCIYNKFIPSYRNPPGVIDRVYWGEMSHYLAMGKHLDWKCRMIDTTCE